MIKEIKFLQDNIVIEEQKKGFFGIKNKTVNINIKLINQIERQIVNQELVAVTINYGNYQMYFIEKQNCEKDLKEVYENIMNIRKENLFEVVETDLTNGEPIINVLIKKNDDN